MKGQTRETNLNHVVACTAKSNITYQHTEGKKVKESNNRPGVAQRVPGGLDSQISGHSAHKGGEVVSLTHRPPLPPENVPGAHFH